MVTLAFLHAEEGLANFLQGAFHAGLLRVIFAVRHIALQTPRAPKPP